VGREQVLGVELADTRVGRDAKARGDELRQRELDLRPEPGALSDVDAQG
jgi:hypothetical protein